MRNTGPAGVQLLWQAAKFGHFFKKREDTLPTLSYHGQFVYTLAPSESLP